MHTEPVITVTGEAEIQHAAERGIVRLTAGFDGPRRDRVLAPTEALHVELSRMLQGLHDGDHGPVTWWSSDQVRVWANRPWNHDGKQLPLVYRTAASFEVKFSDLARLGEWVSEVSVRDGVRVDGVEWRLTEVTKNELTASVQRQAVAAAVAKAERYAQALGYQSVRVIELSDPGLLGGEAAAAAPGAPGGPPAFARMAKSGAMPESSGIEFRPSDISLSAAVNARFVAE